jgi:hypothetical protein
MTERSQPPTSSDGSEDRLLDVDWDLKQELSEEFAQKMSLDLANQIFYTPRPWEQHGPPPPPPRVSLISRWLKFSRRCREWLAEKALRVDLYQGNGDGFPYEDDP